MENEKVTEKLIRKAKEKNKQGDYQRAIEYIAIVLSFSVSEQDMDAQIYGRTLRLYSTYYLLKKKELYTKERIGLKIGINNDINFILEKSSIIEARIAAINGIALFYSGRPIKSLFSMGLQEIKSSDLEEYKQKELIARLTNAMCLAAVKKDASRAKKIKDILLRVYEDTPQKTCLAGNILKNAAICRHIIMRREGCEQKILDERNKIISLLTEAIKQYPPDELMHIASAQNLLNQFQ